MKLLLENWRKFLKEAYPYADKDPQKVHDYLKATDAEKASYKRKAMAPWTGAGNTPKGEFESWSTEEKAREIQRDMMYSLQDHVSLTHQVYLDDHEAKVLLTYINEKNPILVLYSGTAYRGVRLSAFEELLPMLDDEDIADVVGGKRKGRGEKKRKHAWDNLDRDKHNRWYTAKSNIMGLPRSGSQSIGSKAFGIGTSALRGYSTGKSITRQQPADPTKTG